MLTILFSSQDEYFFNVCNCIKQINVLSILMQPVAQEVQCSFDAISAVIYDMIYVTWYMLVIYDMIYVMIYKLFKFWEIWFSAISSRNYGPFSTTGNNAQSWKIRIPQSSLHTCMKTFMDTKHRGGGTHFIHGELISPDWSSKRSTEWRLELKTFFPLSEVYSPTSTPGGI